jgi:lipoate-protein ligase B
MMKKVSYKILESLVDYRKALEYQRHLIEQRLNLKNEDNLVLFLQHSPTYTAGKRIKPASPVAREIFNPKIKEYAKVVHVDRGLLFVSLSLKAVNGHFMGLGN